MMVAGKNAQRSARGRFIGILFECCNSYGRLYLRRDSAAFEGRCPRCYRMVRVPVSEDGIEAHFVQG